MPETGDIVLVDLDPAQGAEQRKRRPCVVLEAGSSPLGLFLGAPITEDKGQKSPIFVRVDDWKTAGLIKPSVVDTYQIRALDRHRIVKTLGRLPSEVMSRIRSNIAKIFSIEVHHIGDG